MTAGREAEAERERRRSRRQLSAAFANLGRGRFALLTTFRRSGEPVATPMWFARRGDHLYMVTARNAVKLRRISHNPDVTVAPCRSQGRLLGPAQPATAAILDSSSSDDAARALSRRYLLPSLVIEKFLRRRGNGAPPVYLQLATRDPAPVEAGT